ncbi:MAG: ABC transporter permease [Peptostreptococcaceae bacterium]
MYNLIKSEFYKLKYGQTFRGLIILSIFCIAITIFTSFNAEGLHFELISTYLNDTYYGFIMNRFADPSNVKGIEFFYSSLGWAPILVVGLMYLIGTLVCEEYVNGTYKNILTYGHDRISVYVSKLFSIVLGIAILICLILLASLMVGTILKGWGTPFNIKDIVDMLKILFAIIIIFISIASIFIFLGTIIKNKALIVTLGIAFIISPVFLLGKIPLDTLQYMPPFMLMDVCMNIPTLQSIAKIIMVCSTISIIFTMLGCYIFKNQDIR